MNFDYTKLFDLNYLLETSPSGFSFANESTILAIVLLLASGISFWLLKKRREFLKLEKEQRLIYRKHAQIAIILSIMLLIFILIRTQGINLLSIRLIPFILSIAIAVNAIVAIIRVKLVKPVIEGVTEKEFNYMKYIPKKKKK